MFSFFNSYKAGTSGIKPPDLWIHHDQMELKNVEKNQDSSGGGTGSGGSLPRESSSLAEKHHPQYMSKFCIVFVSSASHQLVLL